MDRLTQTGLRVCVGAVFQHDLQKLRSILLQKLTCIFFHIFSLDAL